MEIKDYQLEPSPRIVKAKSPEDEIYLTIKIGNGQIGGNNILFEGKQIAKGSLENPRHLGSAESFSNSEIEVETNVLDVNTFTNNCVITTTFFNQDNDNLYTKTDKGVAPENGIASFKGKYLVQFFLLVFFFLNVGPSELLAQNSTSDIEFDQLETPSSPGLILFDQTFSSIEKPTTPQGLGFSLLGFGDGGGALDFNPFWLRDHPSLSAKDMYTNNFPLLSHLSISVASGKTDTFSFMSGGFRTRIFQTYGKKRINSLNSYKERLEELLADPTNNLEQIDSLRKDYVNQVQHPLLCIDLAAAFGGNTPYQTFDSLSLNRWATWLTINWRPKGDDFYATILARYINSESISDLDISTDFIDLGSRLNYDISKVTLSLEYIQRMNVTNSIYDDYRLAIIGSYQINENIFITSTFGKNFSEVNNIVALAGFNFGFSKKKLKAY